MIFKYKIDKKISLRDYLNSYFISKSKIYTLFLEKRIKINGVLAKENSILEENDLLEIDEAQEIDYAIDKLSVDVVYEDDYLLIINKPKGIIIHDDDKKKLNTLSNRVAKYYCDNGLNLCVRFAHRLDFDTTGLIIYVKDSLSFAYMNHFIENHQINRYYLALVEGNFKEKSGKINKSIGKNRHDSKKFIISKTGKEAITNYEVIKNYEGYSLVKLLLETGRTHQIRVHMASIGHPLLGDTLYGKKSNLIDRVALHSFKLSFIHPVTKKNIVVEKELPLDMKGLV
ncbi:MAG: RluA family pseudouridine synthase [Acholeplasmatales bacterium]|nr:RluA family pseudouridine synthase [Acholeplasmatales bacterium]